MNDEINKTTNDTPKTPAELATKQDRKEYMAQYYAENKDEIAQRRKAARIARQEEITAAERERYATDPADREQRLKKSAKTYKTYKETLESDPEAKKKHEERLAKRRQRHKERLATDPEYQKQRETLTKKQREKRQKQENDIEPDE
jgi:hypothetical protein